MALVTPKSATTADTMVIPPDTILQRVRVLAVLQEWIMRCWRRRRSGSSLYRKGYMVFFFLSRIRVLFLESSNSGYVGTHSTEQFKARAVRPIRTHQLAPVERFRGICRPLPWPVRQAKREVSREKISRFGQKEKKKRKDLTRSDAESDDSIV